jgi:hypothetical protein
MDATVPPGTWPASKLTWAGWEIGARGRWRSARIAKESRWRVRILGAECADEAGVALIKACSRSAYAADRPAPLRSRPRLTVHQAAFDSRGCRLVTIFPCPLLRYLANNDGEVQFWLGYPNEVDSPGSGGAVSGCRRLPMRNHLEDDRLETFCVRESGRDIDLSPQFRGSLAAIARRRPTIGAGVVPHGRFHRDLGESRTSRMGRRRTVPCPYRPGPSRCHRGKWVRVSRSIRRRKPGKTSHLGGLTHPVGPACRPAVEPFRRTV